MTASDNIVRQKQKLCFETLGLSDHRLKVLEKVGYEKPTPVQAGMIPYVLNGDDLVGQARTGTGKTAAFAIPILEGLELTEKSRYPQALVLVPTRELAVQVQQEFHRLAEGTKAKCVAIYGGKAIKRQMNRLKEGTHVVVGTPGRILDHLRRATLRVDRLKTVVLDEADRMLDIGFRPDIERILRQCPRERQTLLYSATLPPPIVRIAKMYMKDAKLLNFSTKALSSETIDQYYFACHEKQKMELLVKLLEREQPKQAIIFCRTKLGTEKLYRKLTRQTEFDSVRAIHGDMTQPSRDQVMQSFRDGTTRFLVATDVVGRGIDVSQISHIINYDIPELSDDYVHRVGRTGRMGRSGVAYTFVTPMQGTELTKIEQRINRQLKLDTLDGIELPEARLRKGEQRSNKTRYRRAL